MSFVWGVLCELNAGRFKGVSVVTAASLTDLELFGLLNQDEEISYGFDEPDELTHAHAVTIHARRA